MHYVGQPLKMAEEFQSLQNIVTHFSDRCGLLGRLYSYSKASGLVAVNFQAWFKALIWMFRPLNPKDLKDYLLDKPIRVLNSASEALNQAAYSLDTGAGPFLW